MTLYHGSNGAFERADLLRCRPNKDFGRGFYLTPDFDGAVNMARRTVKRFGGRPHVVSFRFDANAAAAIPIRKFAAPTEEWAMFVMANRRADGDAPDHNCDNRYGIVVGPIANDDLALLFRQFERGLVTIEMLVREMQFKKLTLQYSFHTEAALAALSFAGASDVG